MEHDRLFKELLRTFFYEFLELFLPKVARYVDRTHLEFLDKEVFTDVTTGQRHEADLVVKTRFQGKGAYFLVHVEHQASKQGRFPKRMFSYFARLYEKFDLPVYPVAIFSYEAPRSPEPGSFHIAFPDRTVLEFDYAVIQLNRLNWRDFVRRPNPVASALMAKMRIAPEDRALVKLECLRLLATLHLNPAKMQLIGGFVERYLALSRTEQRQFTAGLEKVEPPERTHVMYIATYWEKKGRREGLREGRREARQEDLLTLFRARFGRLPVTVRQKILNLGDRKLLSLVKESDDLNDLKQLSAWLDR